MNTDSETLLYLSRANVESLNIRIEEVIAAVEEAFVEKARGLSEVPPKPGIHPQPDAFIHAMPALLSRAKTAGVKWVSGFPNNPHKGLPYISGLLILNDFQTGFPQCVMDCTWITAKRTGAATAMAAKYLAPKDSNKLGIIGCGVQGRSNLEALAVIYQGITEVKAFDISTANLSRYLKEMHAKLGLNIIAVSSPRKAVENCDIVVTSGPILKHPRPVIEASWFRNGAFACPLDFDSYWKPEAMCSMDKFCTDDREQLKYYRKQGYFRDIPRVYAELSDIVSGKKTGRETCDERVMSMNLGSAIGDLATAALVYKKAKRMKIGTMLQL